MDEETTAAPPLTVDYVLNVVRTVDWRALGEELLPSKLTSDGKLVKSSLKVNEIGHQHQSNADRLDAVVKTWMQGDWVDKEPSWRHLIWTLDHLNLTTLANSIRRFAEPVLNPTLTLENVAEMIGEVEDWERVALGQGRIRGLRVPVSKLQEIKQQSSSNRERSQLLGEYWVNTDPDASWQKLTHALYILGEEKVAAMAKQYLPRADPTLTTENLMKVVKGEKNCWKILGKQLGVPQFKRDEIKCRYQNRHQRMEAMSDYYMRSPVASWNEVARALRRMELDEEAHEVTTNYVKASERSKELFDQAMKDGYVETRDIKALIFGAAGTGKSHTIALLMDEEPPSVRRSTPCATRPVRAVSRTRAEKRGEKWVEVTQEESLQTIADTATVLPSKSSPSRNTKTSTASSTTSRAPGTPRLPTGDSHTTAHSPSTQGASSITSENMSSVSAFTGDELLRYIEMSSPFHFRKRVFKRDQVILIDTGGQPQFHEVLPIFMRGTSASIFTIKLSERLSDHPLIEYYDDDGNLVGTPYHSAYTNQQILRHCMQVIQVQASQSDVGLCPNTIFIGTHKDLEDQCPESREEKNVKICEMLLPAVQDDAIYFGEEFKELIFPLNVKNPGPQEQEFAADLRRMVVEKSHVKAKQVPLQWKALELALQKQIQELGWGVLTKAECFKVAQRFHFDEESFEEALKYLHSLNILFYYKDVLPDIIFCDPMVLLAKITELVEHSHRLRTNPSQHRATEGKLRKFRSEGMVTLELLSKKEFSSHYVPGVFGPEELLKLFKKLLIVSQIFEEEYLMPCLLPVADDPIAPSGSVPSLLLYFPHGALVGVFCTLVAYLLSEAKWELLLDTDKSLGPVKVDRNTVMFQVPGSLPGKVILTDTFSTYFQVSLQLPRNAPAGLCSKVCPQIRETIMAGLCKASTTLHYSNSVPRDAFLCCEHSDSTIPPHVTEVDNSLTVMTCSRNPAEVCTTLTEQHQLWFGSTRASDATTSDAATKSSPNACSGSQDIKDTKPRMAQLMKLKTAKGNKVRIINTIAPNWKSIGFLMDLDPNGQKVERIEEDCAHKRSGSIGCCQKMFQLWLDGPNSTWGNLIELLIDSEQKMLAEQVKNALGL